MITKKIINPDRVRKINGGFSFIPHRFLSDGFLSILTREEILLYTRTTLVFLAHKLLKTILIINKYNYFQPVIDINVLMWYIHAKNP